MSTGDLGETVSAVGGAIIMIALVAVVASQLWTAAAGPLSDAGPFATDAFLSDGSGNINAGSQTVVENLSNVQQSLGTGVNLSSGDSYSATGVGELEGPLTVTVLVNATTNSSDQTLYTLDSGDTLATAYNSSADEYRAHYYNDASRESATATVSASDVTTPTLVSVEYDGTELQVADNSTAGTAVALSSAGTQAPDEPGWRGTQDELRVFNETLNSSQRQTLISTPTDALAADTDARIMFDARGGENTRPVYYSGGSVDISGAEVVDTVAGQPTDDSDFDRSGNELVALDGGTLDNAPVAFVSGVASDVGIFGQIAGQLVSVLGLLVLVTLVGAASHLINELQF